MAGVLILITAAVLRINGIERESIWLDEAVSIRTSQGSISNVLRASANDSTPFLYPLGLYVWRGLFGDSAGAIRGYSAFWSVVAVLIAGRLALLIANRRTALTAMLFLAIHPFDVYYAQEARMYSQGSALAVAGALLLFMYFERAHAGTGPKLPAAYSLTVLALLLTHYVAVAVAAAQCAVAFVVIWIQRRMQALRQLLLLLFAAAVLFACWYAYIRLQHGGFVTRTFSWIPVPTARESFSFLWREYLWGCHYPFGRTLRFATLPALVVIGGAVAWCLINLREQRLYRFVRLLLLIVLPVGIAVFLSLVYRPVYFPPRFAVLLLPIFCTTAAFAIHSIQQRVLVGIAIAVICTTELAALARQNSLSYKTDWRMLAAYYKAEGPPASLFFYPAYDYSPAYYYIAPPIPHRTLKDIETQKRNVLENADNLDGREIWICSRENYGFAREGERESYEQLRNLGPVTTVQFPTNIKVERITISSRK